MVKILCLIRWFIISISIDRSDDKIPRITLSSLVTLVEIVNLHFYRADRRYDERSYNTTQLKREFFSCAWVPLKTYHMHASQ